MAEHPLGDIEIGDHAVLQRANRGDRAGSAAEHALGLNTHSVDLTDSLVNRNHRRLG